MKESPEIGNFEVKDTPENRKNFKVAVFGTGGEAQEDMPAIRKAQALAEKLVSRGFSINTGGFGGVMKAATESAAKTAKALGFSENDRVNAFVFKDLPDLTSREVGVGNKIRAENYPNRLANLINESKAYIVLNGGQGTIIELFAALESERFNRLMGEQETPKPVIIIDESVKISDLLSATASKERKARSTDIMNNVFVLNLEPESVEIASEIIENYYQRQLGNAIDSDQEAVLKKYSFGEFRNNQINFSEGSGI